MHSEGMVKVHTVDSRQEGVRWNEQTLNVKQEWVTSCIRFDELGRNEIRFAIIPSHDASCKRER